MRYAEAGFDLEIDLSRGSIEKIANDPRDTELYLGGQGIAAKILFERVPPDTDPFSPDNLLIFSTGLLHATPAPAANRTAVNTISPQTNLMSHSLFGGFFGPELKYAGYDRIIIRGKAPDLVYLYINNDKVEIRDATHLRAKGTTETGDQLKRELKDQKVQVAAIGLAGENRVFMASIDCWVRRIEPSMYFMGMRNWPAAVDPAVGRFLSSPVVPMPSLRESFTASTAALPSHWTSSPARFLKCLRRGEKVLTRFVKYGL